nr:hypothetical protein [Streptomyces xiamenensis]
MPEAHLVSAELAARAGALVVSVATGSPWTASATRSRSTTSAPPGGG